MRHLGEMRALALARIHRTSPTRKLGVSLIATPPRHSYRFRRQRTGDDAELGARIGRAEGSARDRLVGRSDGCEMLTRTRTCAAGVRHHRAGAPPILG